MQLIKIHEKNITSVKTLHYYTTPKAKRGEHTWKQLMGKKLALHPGNVKSDANTKACQDNATRQFSTLYTCKGLNSPYGFCPEFNCKKEKNEVKNIKRTV